MPEPQSLRPCCIFGNDVGVQVGRMKVPGYEVQNVLDISDLGTHQYNKGTVSLQPRGGERLLSDEASGILYTCRGGFIDIAHVRDNADRTFYLVSQIARLAATGGTIPLTGEGAERRIVLKPLDARLVRAYGLREVVTEPRRVALLPGVHLARDHHLVWLVVDGILRTAVRVLAGRPLLQPGGHQDHRRHRPSSRCPQ